ncbi:sensor histidine kinase [uncultured Nocardioides sp.]|uniref:sensor histidine kinase n=1 Tax=uncultured Nocardioides sp. TaxID=198441 RepID=UPI00260A098C|nr:sensor histidine kinase [uncultured Nocardioides sp.]
MRRWRPTLAGQLLVLQVCIVVVVVSGVAIVTFLQNDASFRRQEGRRVLQVAEALAGNPVVNAGLSDGSLRGVPGAAEAGVSTYGASYVVVTDGEGTVLYSSRPGDRGGVLRRPDPGRQWLGVTDVSGSDAVEARVPVFDSTAEGAPIGALAGYVVAGREYPSFWARVRDTASTSVVYLALASLVGLGGSLLLSRRIKRQTLGLEPREIAGLVEHREAMLHGLREGVIGVDRDGRVTLVNDEAIRLLRLAQVSRGGPVEDLALPPALADVLQGRVGAEDLPVVYGDRVLILNQMPVRVRDQEVGWVSTLRDRTELVDLNRQLDVWRGTTDTLRSQAHEFSNRMHTVTGLIALGEYDEAARYVTAESRSRGAWIDRVTSRVADATLAALLIAKESRAAELGVELDLADDSSMPAVDELLSADLVTVIGNLIDNALEAVAAHPPGRVLVRIHAVAGVVEATVQDTGPGVPADLAERVFEQGFTTKGGMDEAARGWGLALCRVVCERRGGGLSLDRRDAMTTFTVHLPIPDRIEEVTL